MGGLDQVIDTSPQKEDAEGPVLSTVAKLEAAKAGVTRAQEGTVTTGMHGYLTT